MAYFAQLDDTNTVIAINKISNNDCLDGDGNESEEVGIAFCQTLWGDDTNWKQTSFNTRGGVRYLPSDDNSSPEEDTREGKAQFRRNCAEVGGTWDEGRDSFILKKPYPSWIVNEDFGWYEPPIAYPGITNYQQTNVWDEKYLYHWDEAIVNWVLS
tara:strand:- start:1712 stop:2179 length:468 start_codon:yes stop_codon:yes gene_type:complete